MQQTIARISRRVVGAGLLAIVAAGALAAQGINGLYNVEGRNPDGSTYRGTAQLVELNGAVTIAWQVAGQGYQGTGSRVGDVIRVNWGDQHPVVYVVMPSGQLHGTCANGMALERLVR